MMTTSIYPIHLNDVQTDMLIRQHLSQLFNEKSRYLPGYVTYNKHSEVLVNGDVHVVVTYSTESSMVSSCGTLFEEIIRPYTETQLLGLKEMQMYAIAEAEYEQALAQKRHDEIMAIRDVMFNER